MSDKFYRYMQSGLLIYIGVIVLIILVCANAMYVPHHWLKTPIYVTIVLVVLWYIIHRQFSGIRGFETAKRFINPLLYMMLFGIWSVSAIIGSVDFVYGGDKPPPEIAIIILVIWIGIPLFCIQYMQYVLDEGD